MGAGATDALQKATTYSACFGTAKAPIAPETSATAMYRINAITNPYAARYHARVGAADPATGVGWSK